MGKINKEIADEIVDRNNSTNYIKERKPKAPKTMATKRYHRSQTVSKNALAHIRLGTIGVKDFYNCHPFVKKDNAGRRWTLIHNGTVFDCPDLCKYSTEEEGETDSERILLAIVDLVNNFDKSKRRSEKNGKITFKRLFM